MRDAGGKEDKLEDSQWQQVKKINHQIDGSFQRS
jgi:hypothetical protein